MTSKQSDFFNQRLVKHRRKLRVSRKAAAAVMVPPRSREWIRRRELLRTHPQFAELERAEYAALIAAIERVIAERLAEALVEDALA